MAGGAGGGILIHQDVSVYLYSTFYSVLHILHRLLIQLAGGGAMVNDQMCHFREDGFQVCDFTVNPSGVTFQAIEGAVNLRMHLFTISLKFIWDQVTVWFQLEDPPSHFYSSSLFSPLFRFGHCKLQ